MRRRSSLAVLTVAACNQIYGIGTVVDRDAEVFDAAPPSCPPTGVVPKFDHADLHEILPQDCTDYTRTPGAVRALAHCRPHISEGAPDGVLTTAAGLDDPTLEQPRIAEDGTHGFVIVNPSVHEAHPIRRDGEAWTIEASIGPYYAISEPTSHPHPRVIATGGMAFHELESDGNGSWNEVRTMPLGNTLLVRLSPDGLRMITNGISLLEPVGYWDRGSIDEQFVLRGPIEHSAGFNTAFLTADCGRLYFSTLHGVWFAHQLQ